MSKKNKGAKNVPAQPVKPEPYKYTFRPVHLETPVEIIQSFHYTSTAKQEFGNAIPEYDAPVAVAPVEKKNKKEKTKKAKCGVRKAQNFFFVLTLLVVAALVAAYFMVADVKNLVDLVLNSNKDLPLNQWESGNYIFAIAPFVVAAFLVSIVLRWLVHPIVCKAKKCKHCCARCEFLKYTWTVLFVGVAGAVALVLTQTLGFDKIYNSALNVVNEVLAGNAINPKQAYTIYCLIASVVVLVLLIIISIVHKAKDKRRALLAEEAYYTENNVKKGEDLYGLNNDLANPNHPLAEEKPKKSRTGLKVFLFLVVVAVVAVVVLKLLNVF